MAFHISDGATARHENSRGNKVKKTFLRAPKRPELLPFKETLCFPREKFHFLYAQTPFAERKTERERVRESEREIIN